MLDSSALRMTLLLCLVKFSVLAIPRILVLVCLLLILSLVDVIIQVVMMQS